MSSKPQKDRILVVDDDEMVRYVIKAVLEAEGFEVVEAASGEEALEKFSGPSGPFPLVLMDHFMPGLLGPEALQEIHRRRPNTRLVLLSGATEPKHLEGAPEGLRFFPKPFVNEELVALARRELAAYAQAG